MKRLCSDTSIEVVAIRFPTILGVIHSTEGIWAVFDVDSTKSLYCLCKSTHQLISQWLDQLSRDISRGKEALAIPVYVRENSHHTRLDDLIHLLDFRYSITVQSPALTITSHALPESLRMRLLKEDERYRRIQDGRQVQVCLKKHEKKGWGVYAAQNIRRREYLGEYTGELVSTQEMRRRYAATYDRQHINYVLVLRERVARPAEDAECSFDVVRTNVDGTHCGNFTRFFNHCCEPNLEVAGLRVDRYVPRLVFFAKRDVTCGEELTFDYGDTSESIVTPPSLETTDDEALHPCYCEARQCRLFLPFDTSL